MKRTEIPLHEDGQAERLYCSCTRYMGKMPSLSSWSVTGSLRIDLAPCKCRLNHALEITGTAVYLLEWSDGNHRHKRS